MLSGAISFYIIANPENLLRDVTKNKLIFFIFPFVFFHFSFFFPFLYKKSKKKNCLETSLNKFFRFRILFNEIAHQDIKLGSSFILKITIKWIFFIFPFLKKKKFFKKKQRKVLKKYKKSIFLL